MNKLDLWLRPWRFLKPVIDLITGAFDAVLAGGKSAFILLFIWLLIIWHIYVPIHELMHVWACQAFGGTVEELALKARYGGHLLQKIFPYVVPESDYAGQLTGFSVPNPWAYAAVDFAPYLFSFFGIPLFASALVRRSPFRFALGAVLAVAPFTAIIGDFYEMFSLAGTRLAQALQAGMPENVLLSDDVFKLLPSLQAEGLLTGWNIVLTVACLALAVYAALWLTAVQYRLASAWYPSAVSEKQAS